MYTTSHLSPRPSTSLGCVAPAAALSLCAVVYNAVGLKVRYINGRYQTTHTHTYLIIIMHLKLLCCRPASGPWRVWSVERALALAAQGSMRHARRDEEHGSRAVDGRACEMFCVRATEPPSRRHAPIRLRAPPCPKQGRYDFNRFLLRPSSHAIIPR